MKYTIFKSCLAIGKEYSKKKNATEQVLKIHRVLTEGTKEEMLALEGTNLQYCICSDMRGMYITIGDEDYVEMAHFDGHFEDMECIKVFGRSHDFRTDEQKKGFHYHLSLNPWFATAAEAYLYKEKETFFLDFACGLKDNQVEETIELTQKDIDNLFSEISQEELLEFSLMTNYKDLLGVRGSIYLDGKENWFYYPVHIDDKRGRSICDSMIRLLDEKLARVECRKQLNKIKDHFDNAEYYSWEPEDWIKVSDRGYMTSLEFPLVGKTGKSLDIKAGNSFVDDSGRRYMVRGIEMFSGWLACPTEEHLKRKSIILRPISDYDGIRPERLHYILG